MTAPSPGRPRLGSGLGTADPGAAGPDTGAVVRLPVQPDAGSRQSVRTHPGGWCGHWGRRRRGFYQQQGTGQWKVDGNGQPTTREEAELLSSNLRRRFTHGDGGGWRMSLYRCVPLGAQM